MSVQFIEGWDFQRFQEGSFNGESQDYNNYWSINNINRLTFDTGYSEGQAAIVQNPTGTAALVSTAAGSGTITIPQGGEIRVGFWAKVAGLTSGTFARPLVAIARGNFSTTSLVINCAENGAGQPGKSGYLGSTGPSFTSFASSVGNVFTATWAYYEWYVNETAKTMTFSKNGAVIWNLSGFSYTPDSGNARLVFARPTDDQSVYIDHVVVTNGPALPTGPGQLHAVSVTAAFDRWTADTTEVFKGNLVINGKSYNTVTQSQVTASVNDPEENYAPQATFLYPINPDTNAPWVPADIDLIDGYGVCSEGTFTGDDALRLTSLGLQLVINDPESGFPIIQTIPTGAVVYLSGDWTKSDENLSYGGHLIDIPHTELLADDKYLLCNDVGCIIFNFSDTPPLYTFGITFAEEYREDFRDWVSIDLNGVNYSSYFITGYTILGEGNKKFQSNYVTVNYENIPVGGAYLQGVWDYALDGNTGRWSSRQQIYLGEGNYKHFSRRMKVRGHGKSLQMRVTSEPGKDFAINGWVVQASGNGTV